MADITSVTDTTGENPDYFIEDEVHSTAASTLGEYRLIFPTNGPIFTNNLSVGIYAGAGQPVVPLVEDVDYILALPYIAGTRFSNYPCYGAIQMVNMSVTNIVINYQCLGGVGPTNVNDIINTLLGMVYNQRTTAWDELVNVPAAFPPGIHFQDVNTLIYTSDLIDKLDELKTTIADSSQSIADAIINHITAP